MYTIRPFTAAESTCEHDFTPPSTYGALYLPHDYHKCVRCGIEFGEYFYLIQVQDVYEEASKCNCGADKVGHPGHSQWCNKHITEGLR